MSTRSNRRSSKSGKSGKSEKSGVRKSGKSGKSGKSEKSEKSKDSHDQKGDEYQDQLKQIWSVINELPEDQARDFLKQFPQEIIEDVRSYKANPYKIPVFRGKKTRILSFTTINLTEKYAQRFAMTSLIGFIFRMLDEWKHDSCDKFRSEDDGDFQAKFTEHLKEIEANRPLQLLEAALKNLADSSYEPPKAPKAPKEELKEEPKEPTEAHKLHTEMELKAKIIQYKILLLNGKEKKQKSLLTAAEKNYEYVKDTLNEIRKTIERCHVEIKDVEAWEAKQRAAGLSETAINKKRTAVSAKGEDANHRPVAVIQAEIKSYEPRIPKYEEQLAQLDADRSIVEQAVAKIQEEKGELENSMKKLRKQYWHEFASQQRKKTTKRGGYRTAVKDREWENVLINLTIDKYEATEADNDLARELTKKDLGIEKTAEEHNEVIQDYVNDFLMKYFVYNPDVHVQCAYKPNYEDPLRTPLETDEHRRILEKEYERSLVPPDDTFSRWTRYAENNYESLRQATDDIYCEKSDFEWNIVPLEVFESQDPEEALKKAKEFNRKYAEEFEAEPRSATFRVNNLLGPWEQNREVADFYKENTEIIKRIIDQHTDDMKMGQRLMKDRAKGKNNKKIVTASGGSNDKSFDKYKEVAPTELAKYGATDLAAERSKEITRANLPHDEADSTKDEIEVGWNVIRPVRGKGGKRRIYGKTDQGKFHIPTEEITADNIKMNVPSDNKKKLMKDEEANF